MAGLDALLVVIGDESVPVELRILHGVSHLIREQHRHNERVEELLMGIQDDVNALGTRMGTALDTIEQELGQGVETVDLTPLNAVADRLDSIADAHQPPAPATGPSNTTEFQPLYVVDGDVNTDTSQWVPAAFVTVPDGRPLFTYVGDATDPGSPATADGLAGTWHVYAGDLTPTS